MWHPIKSISFILVLLFQMTVPGIHAEICTGIRLYNNQWQETWLMTPAPEVTLSGKWIALQFDGAMGTYIPKAKPQNYILQTRFSVVPMFRLKFGVLETMLGYGFAYQFRREEQLNDSNQWTFLSPQENSGEFRFLLGLGFSLSEYMNLHLNFGYHYLNKDNMAYSSGLSIGFNKMVIQSGSKKPNGERLESLLSPPEKEDAPRKTQTVIEKKNKREATTIPQAPKDTIRIKTVCLVSTKDEFINEINASIESALIKNGTSVLSWEKIKEAVWQHYRNTQTSSANNILDQSDFFMTDSQILFNGADLFDLDAAIETRLRYIYETYGGEILVNAAYLRALHPKTGEVLISIDYDNPESTLAECKAFLISELLKKIHGTE